MPARLGRGLASGHLRYAPIATAASKACNDVKYKHPLDLRPDALLNRPAMADPFIESVAQRGIAELERREAEEAAARAEALAALQRQEEEREAAQVYQLAFWPDGERALPGDFIACALFTASREGQFVTRQALASINGLTVIFTGKRLSQVHADVWMGIMHLARERMQGDVLRFRGRELLTLIGRHTHKTQRAQLLDSIAELTATDVQIQDDAKRKRFGGSLLPCRSEQDSDTGTLFEVRIEREIAKVLAGNFWCIDWELRKRLRNKPLALWLQTYFARFNKRPVTVEQLHALSGSRIESMRKFRQNLAVALDDLRAARGFSASLDRTTGTVKPLVRPIAKPRRSGHEGQVVLPFVRP
jgi:hypothetical protein